MFLLIGLGLMNQRWLAFDVASFFQLTLNQANEIYQEVIESVQHWQKVATEIGISRAEQERMKGAFRLE